MNHPSKPLPRRLEATSEEVHYAVQKKLANIRRSSGLVKVNLDLDVFRWIFNGRGKRLEKGWILCDESDFSKLNLPLNLHTRETKLEGVVAIDFPVRVKATALSVRLPSGKRPNVLRNKSDCILDVIPGFLPCCPTVCNVTSFLHSFRCLNFLLELKLRRRKTRQQFSHWCPLKPLQMFLVTKLA